MNRPCMCDSRYAGCEHAIVCGAEVVDPSWGPWCSACNPRRLAHISANLEEIKRSYDQLQGET